LDVENIKLSAFEQNSVLRPVDCYPLKVQKEIVTSQPLGKLGKSGYENVTHAYLRSISLSTAVIQ